ncbi:glycerol-3-phosphate dehydrogenase (NAD(+)) [Patescibacteria group bacterium AH-259-L07]|nr:glycerol-3-phosphate dehydrogenase (NAD(+)) [Patescibacteria group bacterium AH-259-L07]
MKTKKISVIGAGNWGTAIARLIANNLISKKELKGYDKNVTLWLYEEIIKGKKLSDIINTEHVNVKYLPGVRLPKNIIAIPELRKVLERVCVIVMVVPHEFYRRISKEIAKYLTKEQKNSVIMVSLSKGIEFDERKKTLKRLTEVFREETSLGQSQIAALSGPNIANDVASDIPALTVIASQSRKTQQRLYDIFNNKNFKVELTRDVAAIEFGGALKNVIALAAGITEGLDLNRKKSVIEQGRIEMKRFGTTIGHVTDSSVFDGPSGKGDLAVSCKKGRNRKLGVALGKKWKETGSFSIKALEKEVLKGQKSQGIGTAREVYEVLQENNVVDEFPIFKAVYEMLFKKKDAAKIFESFNYRFT